MRANALTGTETFDAYVDPFGVGETMILLWLDTWRASAQAALWWNQRWFESLAAFGPAAPPRTRPIAAVIDLAQAAAARTAVEIGDTAAAVIEVQETAAAGAATLTEDAVSAPAHATVPVVPEDDLTCLVGIGPKLAAALADRGVTSFAQIAAWTADDLAEIDRALDLKGRAVRDGWVAQAKRLAALA